MGARRHNDHNHNDGSANNHNDGSTNDHDNGSANDHDDFAAGRGTADCWASRPSDGFPHLHRITAGSARDFGRETGRHCADFYVRNRRIVLIPLSGGLVEIRLACRGVDVVRVARRLITSVCWCGRTVGWVCVTQGASTGCVYGFGSKG